MRTAVLTLAASLLSAASAAAAPPPTPPTDVSPVTVMPANAPPRLVATYPAAGQAVAPGLLVLRLDFDQPMLKSGFDIAAGPGGEAAECLATPRLLTDGKRFALLCRVRPGKSYALAFNGGAAGGFANQGQIRAPGAGLTFTTTGGAPVRQMKDALKAAGLGDGDIPVQDSPKVPPPAL